MTPDIVTHTSDHFDKLQKMCTDFIKNGYAYVDNTPQEVRGSTCAAMGRRAAAHPSRAQQHSRRTNPRTHIVTFVQHNTPRTVCMWRVSVSVSQWSPPC